MNTTRHTYTQASRQQDIEGKLNERSTLKGRRNILEQRISFLVTLYELETMLGMPGAECDSRKGGGVARLLHDVGEATTNDVANLTVHCQAFERAAYSWLSLATDIS